jgi:hypothetical protein
MDAKNIMGSYIKITLKCHLKMAEALGTVQTAEGKLL